MKRLLPWWLAIAAMLGSAELHADEIAALRSDTGLALENAIVETSPTLASELAKEIQGLAAATAPELRRQRGLLFLLQSKHALTSNELDSATQALDQAEAVLHEHGTDRDRSRVALQRLRMLVRRKPPSDELSAKVADTLAVAQRANDDWALSNVHLVYGFAAAERGDFILAEAQAERGLERAKSLGDQRLSAVLLNNLANARKNQGKLGAALDGHFQALSLRRTMADDAAIVQSLSNIVLVYRRMEDWQQARHYSDQALMRSVNLTDPRERLRIALNHVGILVGAGTRDDAKAALQLLADVTGLIDRYAPDWRRHARESEALAQLALGQPKQALPPALAAVQLQRTHGTTSDIASALHALARVYLEQQPAQLDAAARVLNEAVVLAGGAHATGLERDFRRMLAEVFERRGDLPAALAQWKDHERLNQQLNGLDSMRRIAALEQQVANAAREQEVAELRAREELQASQISRLRWITGMVLVSLLAVSWALTAKIRYARKRALADERARVALAGQNQALERLANTDALTGLRNRQWMHQRLDALTAAKSDARTEPTAVAAWKVLALLDIDHFKQINDRYGHDVGDAVLIGIARVLEAQLPAGSACARWGGEEFLVLLQDGEEDARGALDSLRMALFARRDWPVPMAVSCSVGLAELAANLSTAEWLKRADLALYAAKHGGRNQVVTYASALQGSAL